MVGDGAAVVDAQQDDWRDRVAEGVRSVSVLTAGGTCAYRATLGKMALEHLGVRAPRAVVGSMVYRVGPDETRDVVAFCGRGNMAAAPNLFHIWLEAEDNIIDFSVGDWREQMVRTPEVGQQLQPIKWTIDPPQYLWQSAADLTSPWRPVGTPELGTAWYHEGVAAEDHATLRDYFSETGREFLADVATMWPTVKAALPPPLPKPPGRAEARRLRQMLHRRKALP